MVGMPGFEPGVSRTRNVNVTVTPHPVVVVSTLATGGRYRVRTCDLVDVNDTLYQLS